MSANRSVDEKIKHMQEVIQESKTRIKNYESKIAELDGTAEPLKKIMALESSIGQASEIVQRSLHPDEKGLYGTETPSSDEVGRARLDIESMSKEVEKLRKEIDETKKHPDPKLKENKAYTTAERGIETEKGRIKSAEAAIKELRNPQQKTESKEEPAPQEPSRPRNK